MPLPYLTTRSAFSFRRAYGKPEMFMERFAELGIKHVGIADDYGTWGHVPWEKAALAAGLEPLYGARFPLEGEGERRPTFAALGVESRPLYRFSSRPPATETDIIEHPDRSGVIILSGHALKNPDAFDYINLDQRSQIATRAQLKLAAETGKPLILTPFNAYPAPAHRREYLAWDDSRRTYPSHVMGDDELRAAYWLLDDDTYAQARRNTFELAERLEGIRLAKAPIIQADGNLDDIIEEGRIYRLAQGHIKDWTPEYQKRLEYELRLIKEKQYESYFIVVSDMVRWAKERMLVGPARGSSAGSLVCYLTRITEVDPLKHNLLFERFIDVSRFDLPDIDIDFSDDQRHLVFEYMAEKYGKDNVARLGNVSRLKARSAIHHVAKKLGIPVGVTFPVINVLQEHSSGDARYGKDLEDTLNNTNPGQKFIRDYPEAALMTVLEHTPSHTSVHAAGLLVCHEPIIDFCTVKDGVAQVDKAQSEYLQLLKIDALGLRTLGVIEDAECVTFEELYRLELNDPAVFTIFNDQKYAGLFQFEGTQQRRVAMMVDIDDFKRIDHVTALARPGPLVGGASNDYIERAKGNREIEYVHESMAEYLDDTEGVVLYQEQVMRMCFEIGGFDWKTVAEIRKAMSGSKGPEYFNRHGETFVANAVANHGFDAESALALWGKLVTFGSWGMNKSHTVSYGIISYWCGWLKAYKPLEYAAALLRKAKDDEQTLEVLRELVAEGLTVVPFDRERSREHWRVIDGQLIGGFRNLHGFGPVKARNFVLARDNGTWEDKHTKAVEKAAIKFADLRPAHTKYGEMYEKPWKFNVNGDIKEIGDLKDKENAVIIGQVKEVDRRDENEAIRVQRRGNKQWEGNSLFLDISVVDDSVSKPVICRLRPEEWQRTGEKLADGLVADKDWLLLRGRWLGDFNMMIVKKVRCLTNEEILK